MAAAEFYIVENGSENGPFSRAQLIDKISSGTMTSDTPVWFQGAAAWLPARQIFPELRMAPPLPAHSNIDANVTKLHPSRGPRARVSVPAYSPTNTPLPNHHTTRRCQDRVSATNNPDPLTPDTFRYPGEQASLALSMTVLGLLFLLSLVPYGVGLVILIVAIISVKVQQRRLLGNAARVSPSQFPEIDALAQRAANHLRMPAPDVFVKQDPTINAFAFGIFGRKSIALNSATVEAMNPNELMSIIGHELSHIKCGHTAFCVFTGTGTSIYIPIISQLLDFIFLSWSRRAEYTADRGALLACRDINSFLSAMAKVAVGRELFHRLNLQSLIDQRVELGEDPSGKLSEMFGTHPYLVNRFHRAWRFYHSQKFSRLTKGA